MKDLLDALLEVALVLIAGLFLIIAIVYSSSVFAGNSIQGNPAIDPPVHKAPDSEPSYLVPNITCTYDNFIVYIHNKDGNTFDIQSTDPKAHCVGTVRTIN